MLGIYKDAPCNKQDMWTHVFIKDHYTKGKDHVHMPRTLGMATAYLGVLETIEVKSGKKRKKNIIHWK